VSDWNALKKQLLAEHTLIREEGPSVLLACQLPIGKWYVQLVPKEIEGTPSLELAILVGRVDGTSPAALATAKEGMAIGRLTVVKSSIIVEHILPLAGLTSRRLGAMIAALAAEAGRVTWSLRPHVALHALFEHVAD